MRELADGLTRAGAPIRYVDIGGGLPVRYADGDPEPDLDAFARVISPVVKGMNAELIVEPGRFFAAASGVLLARVLYRKRSGGKDYVIADAGMTELLRPSHYADAYHAYPLVRTVDARSSMSLARCARAAIFSRRTGRWTRWSRVTCW